MIKRSGDWYQICFSKKIAYLPIEDAREIFNAEEQAIIDTNRNERECEANSSSYRESADLDKSLHSSI